jgi:Bacterial PH domain
VSDKQSPPGRQVFRSPVAVAIWWLWVLFAAGNLIDLAVQGRDRVSLVAAFVLLFVTGIAYVTAQRPRIVLDAAGLTIANPVRDHRVGWAAVAGADPTDLLRVRCEWPDGDGTARRVIYSWAVHSSRRRQVAAELRALRQSRPGSRSGFGVFGGAGGSGLTGAFGSSARAFGASAEPSPDGDPLRLDAGRVIATLTERAEQARLQAPDTQAAAPVSTWDLIAVASVVIPGLALLAVALA